MRMRSFEAQKPFRAIDLANETGTIFELTQLVETATLLTVADHLRAFNLLRFSSVNVRHWTDGLWPIPLEDGS